MLSPRKNLAALQKELEAQFIQGRSQNKRQQSRIQELRNQAASNPQQLNRRELEFLDAIDQLELNDALQRQAMAEAAELRGYKKELARGQKPSNQERFNSLIGAETERRIKQKTEKLARNLTIGAGVAGTGALAAATATGLAAANGNFPFSLGLLDGDDSSLAAQQFRIEQELEERAFQNQLAQRTAVAQTDLDNKLMGMQQKALFEANLANSIQRQQAGALQGQGGGVDVLSKINAIAAEYMTQGIEPPKAFDLAQNAVRMDGTANSYL